MRRRNNEMLRGKNGKRERESTVELSTCVLSLHPLIVRGQPRGDLEETKLLLLRKIFRKWRSLRFTAACAV